MKRELGTSNIFSLHIVGVAGKINNIMSIVKDAPPINALVTSTSGIPGTGFVWYHDNLWRAKRGSKWEGLSKVQKLEVVKGVR